MLDIPVGDATLGVAIATLLLACVALLSAILASRASSHTLAEMIEQRRVMEGQLKITQQQLDLLIKPRVDVYLGRAAAKRGPPNSSPVWVNFVVVRNAKGGGPAYKVSVEIENTTRGRDGSSFFPLVDADSEAEAAIPAGTQNNDRLEIAIRYKDVVDRDYEIRETRDYH
jgi:hypothetical protein